MRTLTKEIIIDDGNEDNIIWYEDEYFTLIAPCYYSYIKIITLLKKHNKNQKLRINNILNCVS